MQKFDKIRPYYDAEVNDAICASLHHPMMKAMMNFTYPDLPDEHWKEQLKRTHSIRDFQINFAYQAVKKVLANSSEGLTTSGFEKLEPNTSYLFISNHRDIILDTSLLNVSLHDHGLVMTASAIGDNLVQKSFLRHLARLNRNFIIQRGLPPRELLESSKLVSEYIQRLLRRENRSVWIAQREGRTKDGHDATHSGVLKMLAMASEEASVMAYFRKLKMVPVSISYEYDPTDALKMPRLLAESNNEIYTKEKNEDFINLLSGVIGQKKRIHIHVGPVLHEELERIETQTDNSNKQIQALALELDKHIIGNYRLWPTNYIACDLLQESNTYAAYYTEAEKQLFERRLEMRIDVKNRTLRDGFLALYANPVLNQKQIL